MRPRFTRPIRAALLLAPLWATTLSAQSGQAPLPSASANLPADGLAPIRRKLREFDRFLDHHPLIEDDLLLQPGRVEDSSYLSKNPELRDFLRANDTVPSGLKVYPRYFLYRALLREASAPVSALELSGLKEVFIQQPELERLLAKNPAAIRDPVFLAEHRSLLEFITQHSALRQVFLPH